MSTAHRWLVPKAGANAIVEGASVPWTRGVAIAVQRESLSHPCSHTKEAHMDNKKRVVGLIGVLFGIGLPLCLSAKTASFDDNYAKAKTNAASGAGLAYDQQLGTYMQGLPDVMPGMKNCAANHGGTTALHGYFAFQSATAYKVVLQPKNAFSDCIATVLENRHLPAPPTTPYLDPFELGMSDVMSN
jgi:hypothetical protein